jgi:dTDP-4-amino-4,6-dideoxygalactose transaminase
MKLFKKPIFVSVSPNAQADDVCLVFKLIFQPWRWKRGKAIGEIEKMLGEYLGDDEEKDAVRVQTPLAPRGQAPDSYSAITFESGRTALYAILMALGVGDEDEVLIQAFTCTAAANPILWVGAKPVYVDVDENTYNMSPEDLQKKITSRSKILIIQNTFGYPGRIDELLKIAREHSLIVLEDCAHNLGAEYDGKKIGTFGEASFFSFGRSKIISSVFGGAAFAKNIELAKKIREIQNKWNYPSNCWIAQQLVHPVYMSAAKLFYNFFSIGKILVVLGKKLGLVSVMVYPVEKTGGKPPFGPARLPNALAVLAINQMKKLESFNRHRQELAEYYEQELAYFQERGNIKIHPNPPFKKEGIKCVFLIYPIQVRDFETRQKLIRESRKEGIYLESWPAYDKKVIGPDNTDQERLCYAAHSCPIAEKTVETSVNLPTHPNMTMKDAERVIRFLKRFFKI